MTSKAALKAELAELRSAIEGLNQDHEQTIQRFEDRLLAREQLVDSLDERTRAFIELLAALNQRITAWEDWDQGFRHDLDTANTTLIELADRVAQTLNRQTTQVDILHDLIDRITALEDRLQQPDLVVDALHDQDSTISELNRRLQLAERRITQLSDHTGYTTLKAAKPWNPEISIHYDDLPGRTDISPTTQPATGPYPQPVEPTWHTIHTEPEGRHTFDIDDKSTWDRSPAARAAANPRPFTG